MGSLTVLPLAMRPQAVYTRLSASAVASSHGTGKTDCGIRKRQREMQSEPLYGLIGYMVIQLQFN